MFKPIYIFVLCFYFFITIITDFLGGMTADVRYNEDFARLIFTVAKGLGCAKFQDFLKENTEIDVNMQNSRGETALYIAVEQNDYDVICTLLEAPKVNPNVFTWPGVLNPFLLAVWNDYEAIILLFLSMDSVDIYAKNTLRFTAYDYAAGHIKQLIDDHKYRKHFYKVEASRLTDVF